jgi:hypothetical protein
MNNDNEKTIEIPIVTKSERLAFLRELFKPLDVSKITKGSQELHSKIVVAFETKALQLPVVMAAREGILTPEDKKRWASGIMPILNASALFQLLKKEQILPYIREAASDDIDL